MCKLVFAFAARLFQPLSELRLFSRAFGVAMLCSPANEREDLSMRRFPGDASVRWPRALSFPTGNRHTEIHVHITLLHNYRHITHTQKHQHIDTHRRVIFRFGCRCMYGGSFRFGTLILSNEKGRQNLVCIRIVRVHVPLQELEHYMDISDRNRRTQHVHVSVAVR